MAAVNNPNKKAVHIIRFGDNNYLLTSSGLAKQVDAGVLNNDDWRWPTLKFLSFEQDKLTLINTCEARSFNLTLQVQDHQLLVYCSCGHAGATICEHAYAGLYALIWHLGERYFEKLQPGGSMPLAFAHKNYFDKEETTAGLDVAARPELKAVYRLAPVVKQLDLPAMLKLPAESVQQKVTVSEEALSYLIIVSFRNKLLPALLPCMGKLNKNGSGIKTWNHFLSGLQKQYNHLLTPSQQELNTACFHLWKKVEKTPGHIIHDENIKTAAGNLAAIFDAWQKSWPLLRQQPFIYTYYTYGIRDLKNKPAKKRIQKITLSDAIPAIRFVLMDKGAFYQFQMQVSVNSKWLTGYDAGITFFIRHQQTLYRLASLRDAALAEWLHRSGGWITVFKEHFNQFEQEILNPLRQSYQVISLSSNRKSKGDI